MSERVADQIVGRAGYGRRMDLKQLTEEVEAVSRMYAERNGFNRDATWLLLKLQMAAVA